MAISAAEVSAAVGQPIDRISTRRLQTLWAGYGEVSELTVQKPRKVLILKDVQPPAGHGISHERKVRSYEVEAEFYRLLAPSFLERGVQLPQPFLVDAAEGRTRILMSDLREGFPMCHGTHGAKESEAALSWLANFHSVFAGSVPDACRRWPTATYWRLETRPDEFEDIGDEWADLKSLAYAIDAELTREASAGSTFATVAHGDFKSANIQISSGGDAVAALDFQYCGAALGAKDVAYYLASSVDAALLARSEVQLLRHYHSVLIGTGSFVDYSFDAFVRHFELALLDYVRFMAGWGFWGNSRWAQHRAREVLRARKDELAALPRAPKHTNAPYSGQQALPRSVRNGTQHVGSMRRDCGFDEYHAKAAPRRPAG